METKEMIEDRMLHENMDFELRSMEMDEEKSKHSLLYYLKYIVAGILFGIILVKSEVISWFRIQEMFRLQSFHMYGVLGSAVVTGMISVWLIKKFKIKTIDGDPIIFINKKVNKGNIYGGLLFGAGWAMTGACPGPIYAQIGTGASVIIITLLSAIVGTWVYGRFRNHLPH